MEYLELTHGYHINVKTGKKFLKTKECTLSENEREGWFFKEYNKSQWNTISKKCRTLGIPPFKTARKSFETHALQLKVRSEIRDKLLGNATEGIKQNYKDWQWQELQSVNLILEFSGIRQKKVLKFYPFGKEQILLNQI